MRLSYEGDLTQAQEWLGKAQQELGRLRSRMSIGEREQGSFAHALSDTAYVYGGILPGGFEWLHIITTPGVQGTPDATPRYKPTTPDFISGLVTDPRIDTVNEGRRSTQRLKAFVPTAPTSHMHPSEELSHPARLAVLPGPTFESFTPTGGPFQWSQYTMVRPTLYSGTMRKVVQALLGFGKRTGKITKDGTLSIYDLAKPVLDAQKPGLEKIVATKWEQEVLGQGLRCWYDFRFSRTHGITKAADGALWLVEISSGRGIVAMPLPLWTITTKDEFYDKVVAMGDTEAQTMLEELGGFPTGEHFPVSSAEFDAYVKAGRIIRLAPVGDLAPFYQNIMYGSGVGWAFNEDGSEAHNTAYNYDGGNGHQLGVHYACNLQIGASRNTDAGTSLQQSERAARRRALRQRYGVFRTDNEFKDTFEAVMWKIDHASDSDLLTMEAAIGNARERMHELVAMETDAIASGSATVGKMGEGFLWHMAIPANQPQIKFPEPILGHILSHDFRPDDGYSFEARHTPVRCDTTMFVFFKGHELVPVKYFFDPASKVDTHHEDDFEECMYEGAWSSLDQTDVRQIPAGFYSSEFDDRHEVSGTTVDTHIKGIDLGWVTQQIGDDLTFPARGWITRQRGYLQTTRRVVTQGEFWSSAIAVPLLDREAYYYAYYEGFDHRSTTVQQLQKNITDPNFAEYWRVFGGYTHDGQQGPAHCGPLPHHRQVQYLLKSEPPGPCDDLVDQGPWNEVCEDVEHKTFFIHVPLAPTTSVTEPITRHARVSFSCSSPETPTLLVSDIRRSDPDAPFWTGGLWFVNSPSDPGGEMQAIYSTRNSLGDSGLIWIQREPNVGQYEVRGGPQLVPLTSTFPNFVGVINA
jgi:hypothetical protein